MNKKLLRPRDAYLLSFLIPVIIMIVIFIGRGIFPFGSESFLRTDMYHQYAPFFSEFQYKLQNGGSLLYSWNVGLGINFAALFAYYLASPLNVLLLLVPKGFVIEFMTYMIVLKIGLSGLTAAAYFRRHFRKLNFGCAFFGILYAMSGYVAAYSWNIMWLDCILLFPLVLLGLEKLVRREGMLLYVFSLAVCILSNYYISIMICIFLVIYFFCLQFLDEEMSAADRFASVPAFAFGSLLAGALAAFLLLPEIAALNATASASSSFPDTVKEYFAIIDMFARHMPLVETEQGLDHWPNIYCGAMVFLLLPLYFMNRQISLRHKCVYGGLLILFYLSFSLNVLNFIWHGFHYPNSLPCRQSFIYVLLVLSMCYETYIHRRGISGKQLAIALGTACGFILLCQKLIDDEAFEWYTFYAALLFVLIYGLIFYLEMHRRAGYNLLTMALLLTVALESTLNMAVTSVTTTSRTSYTADNQAVENIVSRVKQSESGFYRFEKISRKTKNDGAFMNFPSVSLFSSTASKACSDFFRKLGCEASTNAYSITGSTPLVNMLFSVKYSLYSSEPEAAEERGLHYTDGEEDISLYTTDYALPLGYMLTEEQLNAFDLNAGTPALVQNSLCTALGTEPVLESTLGTYENGDYSFIAETAGEYYVYVSNQKIKEVKVSSDSKEKSFDNVDRGYLLELGYLSAGERVTVKSETGGQSMECDAYRFRFDALASLYEALSAHGMELSSWEDTDVRGAVNAEAKGTMVTSIPYDAGWKAYVDGRAVRTVKVKDTFLGLSLTEGVHSIRFSYFPKGLKEGIVISLAALLLFLILCLSTFLRWKKEKKERRRRRRNSELQVPGGRRSRARRSRARKAKAGKTAEQDAEKEMSEFLPPLSEPSYGGPRLGPAPELPDIRHKQKEAAETLTEENTEKLTAADPEIMEPEENPAKPEVRVIQMPAASMAEDEEDEE